MYRFAANRTTSMSRNYAEMSARARALIVIALIAAFSPLGSVSQEVGQAVELERANHETDSSRFRVRQISRRRGSATRKHDFFRRSQVDSRHRHPSRASRDSPRYGFRVCDDDDDDDARERAATIAQRAMFAPRDTRASGKFSSARAKNGASVVSR